MRAAGLVEYINPLRRHTLSLLLLPGDVALTSYPKRGCDTLIRHLNFGEDQGATPRLRAAPNPEIVDKRLSTRAARFGNATGRRSGLPEGRPQAVLVPEDLREGNITFCSTGNLPGVLLSRVSCAV